MKRISVLAAMLVLTLFALTGCGCRNSKPMATTLPTTLPTIETDPTTASTTIATTETASYPTIQDGNGPISTDSTLGTEQSQDSDIQGRSGWIGGNRNGILNDGAGSGNGISGSITG